MWSLQLHGMSVAVAGDIPYHMQTCMQSWGSNCKYYNAIIHPQDALDNGATTCLVRTVDTDAVAIFVGKFHKLLEHNTAANVWLAFGAGKWFRYIHVNAIYNALGKYKSMALPFFHFFTGCDTTFTLISLEKAAWDIWNSFSEVTNTFLFFRLSSPYLIK